jgi:hypothetical protein
MHRLPLLTCCLLLALPALAEDTGPKINFDDSAANLEGWSAVYRSGDMAGGGSGFSYKKATAWETPFKISLVREGAASDPACLAWEFTEACERAQLRAPQAQVPEGTLTVRITAKIQAPDEVGAGSISVHTYGKDGKWVHPASPGARGKTEPGAEWQEVVAEQVNSGDLGTVAFALEFNEVTAAGKVLVDDISYEFIR